MTLRDALQYGAKLIGHRDAMLLLSHITNKSSAMVLLHENQFLAESEKYLDYVSRHKNGEPLQYIIGKWEFMGQEFLTDNRALIPRPETELLVEEVLKFINNRELHVLDMCTGSGCIAVAIKKLAPKTIVTAVDISSEALELAKTNANNLEIEFIQSDLFSAFNDCKKFDVIISNPPYIPTSEIATLETTVRDYEPHLALDGGADGLVLYRRLVPESFEFLHPNGVLFLEIGHILAAQLLIKSGFKDVKILNDYAEIPRIITGKKGVTTKCLTV